MGCAYVNHCIHIPRVISWSVMEDRFTPVNKAMSEILIIFIVRGFKPSRDRWIFSERKNPEYDFLQNASKAVGPVS